MSTRLISILRLLQSASLTKKRHIVTSEDEEGEQTTGSSKTSKEPEQKKTRIGVDETIEEMAQDLQDIAAEQLKDIKPAPASGTSDSGGLSSAEIAKRSKKNSPPPTSAVATNSKAKPPSIAGNPTNKGKGKAKIDPDDDEEEEETHNLDEDVNMDSPGDADEGEDDDQKEEADKKEMNEAAMKLASTYAGTLDSVTKDASQWKEGAP